MAAWYCGSTKWAAIAQWAASTAYSVGQIVRQLASPSNFNERAFRCTTAGTSGASEPTWNLNVGATTNDNTVVWTEVTGNENYGWAAAARQLKFLCDSRAAAGDTIYLSNNHAYSVNATNTIAIPGSAGNCVKIICVDDSATPPTTPATGAQETITVTSNNFFTGFGYVEGLIFISGDGTDNGSISFGFTSPYYLSFKNCSFRLGGTSASAAIMVGGSTGSAIDDAGVEWNNCTVSFAATGQGIGVHCPFKWYDTPSALLGTMPNDLFSIGANSAPYVQVLISGVDLSATNNTIIEATDIGFMEYNLVNCKISASATIASGTPVGPGGVVVRAVHTDSGDTNYNYYLKRFQGEIFDETTIVRTGGASDGTTAISRKVVTNGNAQDVFPLKADPIEFWNEVLTAQTISIEIVSDNITFKNNEIWIEVEYFGVSGFPRSVIITDFMAHLLATPANQDSSSATWTTTGLTTPIKQKLSVTLTAQEKGKIKITVCAAKKNATFYFCPKPVIE